LGPAARDAVPALEDALRDKQEADLRMRAALALGAIGPAARSAQKSLINATADPEARVRVYAADALGRIDDTQIKLVVNGLREVLKSRAVDVRVRTTAAAFLGELGPRAAEARPELNDAAKEDDPQLREKANEALKLLGR